MAAKGFGAWWRNDCAETRAALPKAQLFMVGVSALSGLISWITMEQVASQCSADAKSTSEVAAMSFKIGATSGGASLSGLSNAGDLVCEAYGAVGTAMLGPAASGTLVQLYYWHFTK